VVNEAQRLFGFVKTRVKFYTLLIRLSEQNWRRRLL